MVRPGKARLGVWPEGLFADLRAKPDYFDLAVTARPGGAWPGVVGRGSARQDLMHGSGVSEDDFPHTRAELFFDVAVLVGCGEAGSGEVWPGPVR